MTRARIVFILCFAAAFAAGVGAGLAVSRRGRRGLPPHLVEELGLTAEQTEQVRAIWSEAGEAMRAAMKGQREALEQERDAATRALLTEEQVTRYEQVMKDFESKREAARAKAREIADKAVERTKEILTPEQKAKYEKLLERRGKRGGPRWGPGPPPGPPPDGGGMPMGGPGRGK